MDSKIKEAVLLSQLGIAAEKKQMYKEALYYYGRAGGLFVTLSLYHPVKEKSEQMKSMAEEIIAKGNAVKKILTDNELKKLTSKPIGARSNIRTDFTLSMTCAELYRKYADNFYKQAVDKNSVVNKKQLLQSALNAYIIEIDIKKMV